MEIVPRLLLRVEMGLLRLYRAWSATRLPRCRYIPTCSVYAVEALQKHRFLIANRLIFRRILHCHPWGNWGYDPVPVPPPPSFSQGNSAS